MIEQKISPDEPIVFFVRIKGAKGTRELRAILDTGSQYCVVPMIDAIQLGYDAYFVPGDEPGEGTMVATQGCIIESREIVLKEISVGDLVAKDVKAFCHELPRPSGLEVVLGLSFLKHFKTTIDYKKGVLTLEALDPDVA
ncbi:retroviral-like aspartic protease family protein [Chloroflexota bacterium]